MSGDEVVILYTSRDCAQCMMTKRVLDQRGIPYRIVDIDTVEDPAQVREELRSMGFQCLPVVITPSQSWSGFRPERIERLTA